MERFKRVFSIALATIMAFGLIACGKKGEGDGSATDGGQQTSNTTTSNVTVATGKDYIYKFEQFDLGLDPEAGYDVVIKENCILAKATIYKWPENMEDIDGNVIPKDATAETNEATESKKVAVEDLIVDEAIEVNTGDPTVTVSIKLFGMDKKEILDFTSEVNPSEYLSFADVDKDLNIYMVLCTYGEEVSTYVLKKMNKDGEVLFEVPIGENASGEEYWINSFVMTTDRIIMQSNLGFDIFELENGNLVSDCRVPEADNYGRISYLKDGKFAVLLYGEKEKFVYIDPETGKVGDEIKFPTENLWNYDINSGKVHDFVMSGSDGLYAYNIGDSEITKLMDFISSDMVCNGLSNINEKDENSFYATYYDDEGIFVGLFTKVPPEEYVEKQVITLGCFYLNFDVRRDIVNFNKSQDKYRIVVKDYENLNESGEADTRTLLNNDIMAGKLPDILMIPSYVDVSAYEAKGLFEDLGAKIDADSSIKREDYLENVFKAASLGDKMYKLIPSFYVYSVGAKKSVASGINSWTMKDFNEYMSKQDSNVSAFGRISKQNFLYYAINFNMRSYVDWQNGEAHFDSEEFINTLKYTDNLKKDDDLEYDEEYWNEYDSMYRDGRALFYDFGMYDYRDWARADQQIFNGEMQIVGFPSEDGNGSVMGYDTAFYISASSQGKDGAWEFVKTYLSDEKQTNEYIYGFPIKKSALSKKQEAACKGETLYGDDGKPIDNCLDLYYTESGIMAIKALTPEKAKEVTNFIMSVDKFMTSDTTIMEIINEEAETYFNGQKKAEDVAGVIQNRAQTYIYEKQ